jgi:hypothetical protein
MKIKQGAICPLIKIKSPKGVDFYLEHNQLIKKNGYVWFCRFGKNNMKKETLEQYAPYILIKESGIKNGGLYIAKYSKITETPSHAKVVPLYYSKINQLPSMWFKVNELERVDYSTIISSFIGNASGGSIQEILRTMCPAFYVRCTSSLEISNNTGGK